MKLRRRNVTCQRLGQQVNDRECIHEPKPEVTVSCYDECLTPHWQTHPWEPVSIELFINMIHFYFTFD